MPIRHVVIVHGHDAKPIINWFTDLAELLKKSGVEVLIPWMPSPHLPEIRRWKERLRAVIRDNIEETAIIGHSFGGVSALRLAEGFSAGEALGALIVVAAPVKWVWHPRFPARVLFREPNWDRVRLGGRCFALVYSDNDWIAPVKNAAYLEDKLGCKALILHGYGHLCLPELPLEAKMHIIRTLGFEQMALAFT